MKLFEIFYNDGNRRLLETENIIMLMQYLVNEKDAKNIYKIIERKN